MFRAPRRAKKRTSGQPKSCRRRRMCGVASTTLSCGTCARPGPSSGTWQRAGPCATCRRSWKTRGRNKMTKWTRTWSNVRTAHARSMRRQRKGTYHCAPIVRGTRPPGCRTRNDEPATDVVAHYSFSVIFFLQLRICQQNRRPHGTVILRPVANRSTTKSICRRIFSKPFLKVITSYDFCLYFRSISNFF